MKKSQFFRKEMQKSRNVIRTLRLYKTYFYKCPHEFGSTIISRCGTGVENTIWVEVFPKR